MPYLTLLVSSLNVVVFHGRCLYEGFQTLQIFRLTWLHQLMTLTHFKVTWESEVQQKWSIFVFWIEISTFCVCVCVCVCVCACACVCSYVYCGAHHSKLDRFKKKHAYVPLRACVHTHTYMHVCTCMHAQMHAHMCACMHIRMHTHTPPLWREKNQHWSGWWDGCM